MESLRKMAKFGAWGKFMSLIDNAMFISLLKRERVEEAFPILPEKGRLGNSREGASSLYIDTSIKISGEEDKVDILKGIYELEKLDYVGWVHTHPSGADYFSIADKIFFNGTKHKYPIFGVSVYLDSVTVVKLLYKECENRIPESYEIEYYQKLIPNTRNPISFGGYRIGLALKPRCVVRL